MDSDKKIPPTIDNQLEGMREHLSVNLRSDDLGEGSDDDELGIAIDPISSEDGSPDQIPAFEQVKATWSPGAPETAFGALPPENDDEILTAQSLGTEEWSDEDLAMDSRSSLEV